MLKKIVLASQSPRRKQLLEWAEIEFDVMVKPTDETYPDHLPLDEIPIHIARNKALALRADPSFQQWEKNIPILAADTVVVLEGEIIGKPENESHAIEILTRLSGKKHEVITGVVIFNHQEEISFSDSTAVWFHELSKEEIQFYVQKYKPYDKAGAYAIQEWIGVVGIKKIEGDFYNVMGLPVSRVVQAIAQL